jgi:excinuclease ABC subunit B
MESAAEDLNFEVAAEYRDRLIEIKNQLRDLEIDKQERNGNRKKY